jgi:hypothetical protein
MQTAKQRFVSCEKFSQSVDEKALAEAARAGEEVILAFVDQAQGEGRLVDVVMVILADFAESLDADGQFFYGSWRDARRWRQGLDCSVNGCRARSNLPSLLKQSAIS